MFVRHGIPGERVKAVVTKGREGDRFVFADAIEVLTASPDRVEPRCPVSGPGGCGGCDFQHVSMPRQRALKAHVVAGRGGGRAWRRSDIQCVDLTGED